MVRHSLLALALVAFVAGTASSQETGIPVESMRHKPEHMSTGALHRLLEALVKRHGDGLSVKAEGDVVVVTGLPEDVESLRKIVLVVDLAPIQPVQDRSLPQDAEWESDALWVCALHTDVEGEHLQNWLTQLIGYHPTTRSLQMFWLPEVRRVLVIGKPAEVDMASKAATILLEAYQVGFEQGQAEAEDR